MNISAINSTPIKPQKSFGHNEDDNFYEKYAEKEELCDKINDQFVNSANIKKPVAVVASVAVATLLAFATGAKIFGKVRMLAPEITNPESSKYFENYIKKGANKIKGAATKLQESTGKTSKIKNVLGKGIEKGEKILRTGYKKITSIGTKNMESARDIAGKKFENLAGAAAVAAFVPSSLSKDNNADGISDLCQTGVNAYTGSNNTYAKTHNKIEQAAKTVNALGEIVDLLS